MTRKIDDPKRDACAAFTNAIRSAVVTLVVAAAVLALLVVAGGPANRSRDFSRMFANLPAATSTNAPASQP